MMTNNFHTLLETITGRKLKLRINENRSTMLSVRWEPDYVNISLHRIFLQAPTNIMEALACYIRREDRTISKEVRRFIEEKSQGLDYSSSVVSADLKVKGDIYDLSEIYQRINERYFNGKLDLKITWYGRTGRKARRQINLGLYHSLLLLVKIHGTLDHPTVPLYVVEFVVYHEMLHHVCRPTFDKQGTHRIHTPEFYAREKEFLHYEAASKWIKENHDLLFGGSRGRA